MEDLATDRIYRLMIAQRMMHSDAVEILDETGKAVRHTTEFIARLFDEELERLLGEASKENDQAVTTRLRESRRMSEEMIHRGEFDPA
jgi:malate synthase